MKIGAVIAEFNPFHTGHRYLIDQICKECDAVVAIMSGNFVQRGECAIFDKSERAKSALENGVDLILELPSVYALSSAEGFSTGAVSILKETGVIDSLYFGSECGNIETLTKIAELLNNETSDFKKELEKNLRSGMSFPASRLSALKKFSSDASVLNSPNNILAVEYIRQAIKNSFNASLCTVQRIGGGYNDISTNYDIISASAIRKLIKEEKALSGYTSSNFKSSPLFMQNLDSIIAARVKSATKEDLCLIPDCNEELSSRIIAASKYNTFEEILSDVSCKSYTKSRIRRILCNLIIGNRFSELPKPDYIRILGFNENGSRILSKMKSTASLPVIARGALLKTNPIFNLECRATDIYNLAKGIQGGEEFKFTPLKFPLS